MIGGVEQAKALAFLLVALMAGVFLRPRFADDTVSWRVIAYWLGSAVIIFMLPVRAITIPLLGFLLLILTPPNYDDRAGFAIATILAVPFQIAWVVPFPGINYLITINHPLLHSLVVMIPLMFVRLPEGRQETLKGTPIISFLFVVSVFLPLILSLPRSDSMTNSIRILLVGMLVAVPAYFGLKRALLSRGSFMGVGQALCTAGAMMIMAGLLASAQNWNHYQVSLGTDYIGGGDIYRTGSARVALTTIPVITGWLMFGFLLLFYTLREQMNFPRWGIYAWMGLAFLIFLQSQSRGAYLAGIVMVGTFLFAKLQSNSTRVLFAGTSLIGLIGVFVMLSTSDFQSIDQYGTFNYRQELLSTGITHVLEHPFFGDPFYATNPRFEHLRQGQGIIDFVNTYLVMALSTGLIGLVLCLIIYARAGFGMLRGVDRLRALNQADGSLRRMGIVLMVMFAGFLAMVFTVSPISYIPHLFILFTAVGIAYTQLSHAIVNEPVVKEGNDTVPPVGGTVTSAPKEMTRPPKKRFEIDVAPGARGWPG